MDERSAKRRRTTSREDEAQPDEDNERPRLSPRETRRRRSSYASPTRASLARFDPEGLQQRDNEDRERQQERSERAVAARPSIAGARVAASDAEGQAREEAEDNQTQPEPPRSQGTPTRPNPRPFPPPGPSEDAFEPVLPRRSRPGPATGITIPPRREPSLPPSANDSITSTPPKGIHSSPSKWRSGGKRKAVKSSPLKQPPLRGDGTGDTTLNAGLQRRASRQPLAEQDENADLNPMVDPARKILTDDSSKRKVRDKLQEEVAQLRQDLQTAGRENERLLRLQSAGRGVEPANKDRILDLLRRYLLPEDLLSQPPQSQQLLMAALNPMGLLPFSKPVEANATKEELESLANIKSHHPVVMTAEEELPYLQLFSPFEITTSIAALPRTTEHPFRQRRIINVRSRHTPALFHSRVEMIVNPMTLAILEMGISALDPAARLELGQFADKICSGQCNRSMQRNVGVLSWAMGEWHRTSILRAEAWARLDKEVSDKRSFLEAAAKLRARKRTIDHGGDNSSGPQQAVKNTDLIRFMGQQNFDITIQVDSAGSSTAVLRLQWKIDFDWTGEAENSLSILIGVPGKWRKVDGRGSLSRLPKLFQDLVQGGEDVATAARKIAALMLGEQHE